MTGYNYGPISAKAQELVAKFGKDIQLIKLAAPAADALKPWEGGNSEVLVTYQALMVDPGKLGLNVEVLDFLKQSRQVAVIATTDDLTVYHKMLEGAQRWKITGMQALKPAGTSILWYVGVAE